jgi:hypothetical protein
MAGPADEDALFDLMMALDADNSFGIPYDADRVRAAIKRGTEHQGSIIGVIDGRGGTYGEDSDNPKLVASICVTLAQFWYSNQWYLAEQWVFVRPDYRHNRFENDLFQFAKWCKNEMSRQNGDDTLLVTSVSSPNRLPAKLRLWSRHAQQIGGIFVIR